MKTLLLTLLIATAATTFSLGQKVTYQLSSHILDVSKGMPASGVSIKLEKRAAGQGHATKLLISRTMPLAASSLKNSDQS